MKRPWIFIVELLALVLRCSPRRVGEAEAAEAARPNGNVVPLGFDGDRTRSAIRVVYGGPELPG